MYEPGSTFKVVTFSAALSAGVVWPGEVLHNVPDFLNFGDKVIHDDTSRTSHGTSPCASILKISSNIGTDEIAQMVGEQGLMQWIHRYGFGRETALRFPGESPGIVLPGRDWTESSIGTIPIGQGIGVTAMQMASMYQAIANGGVMVEPHIVQQIQGRRPPRRWQRRVLSPSVDHQLVSMLEGVVDSGGTAYRGDHPRIYGRRQDRHRPEAKRPGRLLEPVRRLVHRLSPGREPPGRDHDRGRLAPDEPLRRRRRGAGVRADRLPGTRTTPASGRDRPVN